MGAYNGTFRVTLLDQEFTLRPSFEALCEFEDKTGLACNEAFNQMSAGKMSIKVVTAAIWAGILGEALYKNNPKLEKSFKVVGEMVRKEGITHCIKAATDFFMYGIVPEEDIKKLEEKEDSAEVDEKKNTLSSGNDSQPN